MLTLTRSNPCIVVKYCMLGCLSNECGVGLPALKMPRPGGGEAIKKAKHYSATAEMLQLEFENLFSY